MGRTRRRKNNHEFLLFPERTTLGWRVIGRIGYEAGERRVDQRTARRVVDENHKHIGYQLCDREFIRDQTPVMLRTSASITAAEMLTNAGTAFKGGQSKTVNMPEERRLSRVHPKSGKLLPAEDRVERVVEKVKEFGEGRLMVAQPEVKDEVLPCHS